MVWLRRKGVKSKLLTVQRAHIPLQTVHLVGPPCSISAQSLIFRDTRPNNSDPVGPGFMMSAAGSGSRGTPAGDALAQQPVNTSTLSGDSFFSILAGQDGTAVVGISTISFLLHCALNARLSFKGRGPLGEHSCVIARGAIPTRSEKQHGQ